MVDVTTVDVDVGVALDQTGDGSLFATTATTIDIAHAPAAKHDVAGIGIVNRSNLVAANLAIAGDGDVCTATHGTQLAAAIDAGLYNGICDAYLCTVGNVG